MLFLNFSIAFNKTLNAWKNKTTIIHRYCLKDTKDENKKKLNVLDIGCGLGYDSIIFADIGGCKVHSIDAVPQFLDCVQQNIERVEKQNNKHLDIDVINCDFTKLLSCDALMGQQYDILWNNASLMHLSKTEFNTFLHDIHEICTGNTVFGSLFFQGN
eukprot:115814_1